MSNGIKLALLALAATVISASAQSAPLSLVDTGAAGIGAPETSWVLSDVSPAPIVTVPAIKGVNPYGTNLWVTPPTGANWISPYYDRNSNPVTDPNAATRNEVYTYTLDFTNPKGLVDVQWASDNNALFCLNVVTCNSGNALSTTSSGGFKTLTDFSIAAGAFLTNNVFTVVVTNLKLSSQNPTGLLAAFKVSEVPLPPAALLFGTALLGLFLLRRRRPEADSALAA